MARAREAIAQGRFASFADDVERRYAITRGESDD